METTRDGDSSDGETAAGDDGGAEVRPRNFCVGEISRDDRLFFDIFDEAVEREAEDIRDVDGECADGEREIYEENGNYEARKGALDSVIVNSETGEL